MDLSTTFPINKVNQNSRSNNKTEIINSSNKIVIKKLSINNNLLSIENKNINEKLNKILKFC